MIINQEKDHLVRTDIHLIEVEEILAEIIDQITEVDHEKISEMITDRTITGKTTDEIIIDITTGKAIQEIIIEIKGLEMGIDITVGMDAENVTEIVQDRTLNETEGILIEIEVGKENHNLEERKTEEIAIDWDQNQGQGLDLVQE